MSKGDAENQIEKDENQILLEEQVQLFRLLLAIDKRENPGFYENK